MNYLTNHYKNLCEQYQSKINILQNLLNEDAPASTFSGTGQGQQTFSDEQLRDQMKQNKRSNAFGPAIPDDKQNQAYRDAQAELARRQGKGGVNLVNTSKPGESPRVDLDPSIRQSSDVKTDRVAGDWVERYAQKLGEDPRKIEAMRRGVMDTLGGDAGKPMDTSMTSNEVAQRGVDAYNQAKEYVIDLQNQAKAAKPATAPSSAPARVSTPSTPPAAAPKTKPEAMPEVTPETTPTASLNAKEVNDTIIKLTGMNQNIPEPDATETKIPEMGRAQSRRTTYVVPESEAWNNLTTEEQHEMISSAISNNEVHKFFGGRLADTAFDKNGLMGFTTNPENFRFSEDNSGQTPEETARINRQAKMLNQMMAEREKQGQRDTQQRKAREAELSGQTISTGGMNQPMDLADFPDDEDTDKQSSSAELENARKLAQWYADRMGGRASEAAATPPVAAAPKEQVSSLESKFRAWQDQKERTASMPLVMAEKPSSRGSNIEGQALENDSMARARYERLTRNYGLRKDAEADFVKEFGRLPNPKSAVDNEYIDALLHFRYKLPRE